MWAIDAPAGASRAVARRGRADCPRRGMDALTTPAPLLPLEQEFDKLMRLFAEYDRLAADGTGPTDLGARLGRIGGRVRAIVQFEHERVLPRLPAPAVRGETESQIADLQARVERLAARAADQAHTEREMRALAQALRTHAHWQQRHVWPRLGESDLSFLETELAEWRAGWLQDEAPD